ncbi:MAG: acetate kinase, partial [Aquihabitans sp.]
VRSEATANLAVLGITVDDALNSTVSDRPRVISPPGAPVTVLVVPTDEELAIARQVVSLVCPAE